MSQSTPPKLEKCPICGATHFEKILVPYTGKWSYKSFSWRGKSILSYRCAGCGYIMHFAYK